MDFGDEWGWVVLAYSVTYISLVAFAWSMASRIRRARLKLGDRS
jgi:hypothetical protein